jgi:nucleoside 2-deoxyribosyltransferase
LTDEEKLAIEHHVAELESRGVKVHWPPRDTPQDDPVGYNICCTNRDAIKDADEVHVFWNPTSRGSAFDFGMAFALGKPIRLINDPAPTPKKSFENVLRHAAGR